MKPRYLTAIMVCAISIFASGVSHAWNLYNNPPEAIIFPEYDRVVNVGSVQICSISVDPDCEDEGYIVKEEWDFDEGTGYVEYPVGTLTSHTFSQPGVYHVKLRVTDNGDYWGQNILSDEDTRTITVVEPAPTLLFPSGAIYTTIQEAIDAASNGDTIIVLEGLHVGEGNCDLDFQGKTITIRSTNPQDPAVVAATIIDCQGRDADKHRGFYFHNGEGDGSVVSGLTIKNGYQDYGSGIYCSYASPTITYCTIINNTATYSGGGIYCHFASPAISYCTIMNNTAGGDGGGMYNNQYLSSPIINSCSFISNSALGYYGNGGGICNSNSCPVIKNCVFLSNSAYQYGGGIYCYGRPPTALSNCTFTDNSANQGGGIGNRYCYVVTLANCILWDNHANTAGYEEVLNVAPSDSTEFSYSDVKGCRGSGDWNASFGIDGGGNIDEDPKFVESDYHIQSDSPCIDKGDPLTANYTGQTDVDDQRRVISGRVDIGADEYKTDQPIYVDCDVATSGDGLSWGTAIKELRDALSVAGVGDEIWVAEGTYKPTDDTDRTKSFNLKYGVSLYGGFNGDETHRNERAWANHKTILSGDIDGDDLLDTDNSYHVVKGANGAIIDSFVIMKGYASGTGSNSHGGGMYNDNSSPVVRNCSFLGNKANANGGGIYNYDIIADGDSFPEISNCIFSGNIANGDGGGISNYGAFLHPTIINCTFSANSGMTSAGGISNRYNRATVVNSIFWDTINGGCIEIYNENSPDSIIFSYSDLQGRFHECHSGDPSLDGGNNIDRVNPLFVDPLGPDTTPGTIDDNVHLEPDSPCKGMGIGGKDMGVNWPTDSVLVSQATVNDPVDIMVEGGSIGILSSNIPHLLYYDLNLNPLGTNPMTFLSNPTGIGRDNDNSFYVDGGNHKIWYCEWFSPVEWQWLSIGSYGSELGQFNQPQAISGDSEGLLYVSDSGNNRIQVLKQIDHYTFEVYAWGSYGSAEGELNFPTGSCGVPAYDGFSLMLSNSEMYLADTGNNRVQKLSARTGNFYSQVGGQGTHAGQFNSPRDVCYDIKRDQLIVADTGNNRIQTFQLSRFGSTSDNSITFVKQIANQGLSSPLAVACTSTETDQIIFVADTGNDRVVKLKVEQYEPPANTPLVAFETFKSALRTNDMNKAASFIEDASRDDYVEIFQLLGTNLQDYVDGMGQMTLSSQASKTAKAEMSHKDGGQTYSFPVTFTKDEMGNWKISKL